MFISLLLGLVVGQTSGPLPVELPPIEIIHDAVPKASRTPLSAQQARLHLELAYVTVIGTPPSPQTLSRMMAQWALETARGTQMWGYNFGGLKAARGGVLLRTHESFGTTERWVEEPFRAYRSAAEGASDYVRTLAKSFPKAFTALHEGSIRDYVRALAEESYFTGSPEIYHRAITLLSKEYARTDAPPKTNNGG